MSRMTLWIRAGSDGVHCGGDPAAHQLFMLMLWKSELDPRLKFDVKTVNEARPPQEFKDAGLRRTPALQVDEETGLSVEDEIVDVLDRYGPARSKSSEAENVTSDLFRVFAFFIKDVRKESATWSAVFHRPSAREKADMRRYSTRISRQIARIMKNQALLGELQKIDHYLQSTGSQFLVGDEPSYVDCFVLPRLHSIRIASKALKDFDIPSEFTSLRRYMKNGYQLKSFTTSCPCDQIFYEAIFQENYELYHQQGNTAAVIPTTQLASIEGQIQEWVPTPKLNLASAHPTPTFRGMQVMANVA